MTISTTSGLAGLALLTGDTGLFAISPLAVQSRAVRVAKAQFTLPSVAPPWKQTPSSTPLSAAVGGIKRMASIVDQVRGASPLAPDVQTSFTTYKALDRLRMLADWASRPATSAAERTQLQQSFATGIADLQRFLVSAPGDRLTLAFGVPGRSAQSLLLGGAAPTEHRGTVIAKTRDAPLSGLSGNEQFTLTLSRPTATDTLTVDLSSLPQPPTLDGILAAFNTAIAAVPMRDSSGNIVLDAAGTPRPRWDTSFKVVKGATGWGLQLTTMGVEQVSLQQVGASNSLMVAAGQSVAGTADTTALMRFDLSAAAPERIALGSLSAVDRLASERAELIDQAKTAPISAPLATSAMVSDAQGFTYLLGTSAGDLGTQAGDGANDLALTKLDSRGTVIWQRSLGTAGSAEGAAIGVAPDGDIIVAGTASGDTDGAQSDGDLLVAGFSALGEERFATLVRAPGADRASAVAVGSDGSINVGGNDAAGNGVLARLTSEGTLVARETLSGEPIRALATDNNGALLALSGNAFGNATLRRYATGDLTQTSALDLGASNARSLAVAADGRIAVAGTGGGDVQLALVSSDLTSRSDLAIASAGEDQVDDIAWLGNELHLGGRTTGDLAGARSGVVDGYLVRVDGTSRTVIGGAQWGLRGTRVGQVRLAAAPLADSATLALGFRNGLLNPSDSPSLIDQTSLREGDSFGIRVDGGKLHRIDIERGDTLASLAERLSHLAGRNASINAVRCEGGVQLRVEAKAGRTLELVAGPEGHDALAKLRLPASRLVGPPPFNAKAPRVTPGGHYGLELSRALSIDTEPAAKLALGKLTAAITTTQSAFRSLFWDSNKEALVNGAAPGGAGLSRYQGAQLGRYQAALARLGGS